MIFEKLRELTSYLWLKIIITIPVGMLMMEEKEKLIILALLLIITIDCIFGAGVAWKEKTFHWGILGKKFSKKFLLYFFTLVASFIISNTFCDILGWWFYTVSSIVTLSEFGSLMTKANKLGFPVGGELFTALSEKIRCGIWKACGIEQPVKPVEVPVAGKNVIAEIQEQTAKNTGKIAEGKERRKILSAEQNDIRDRLDNLEK